MSETTSNKHTNRLPNIKIIVNRQQVILTQSHVTGRAVKEAAISQGVKIELDFELAQIEETGDHQIIGDDQEIIVEEHDKFVATAPDDNSQSQTR